MFVPWDKITKEYIPQKMCFKDKSKKIYSM